MELNLIVLVFSVSVTKLIDARGINVNTTDNQFDFSKFLKRLLADPKVIESDLEIATIGDECNDVVGWCNDYKHYCNHDAIKNYCRKTCNTCPVVEATTCEDMNSDCATGVGFGYCTGSDLEISFMKKNCQKSCGFCKSATKKCKDKQSLAYCHQIKKLNYCTNAKYKTHFQKYCPATCEFCKSSCGISEKTDFDIVDGRPAQKGYYPWQVAVYHQQEFLCGGSLIGDAKILTAAHCFNHRSKNATEYKVVLGEHNRGFSEGTEQIVSVSKIIIHENYDFSGDEYDIAVMIMSENAKISKYIYPICLPETNAVLKPGALCYVTGWGKLFSSGQAVDLLHEVQMPIAERSACEKRNSFNFHKITEKMICAGYDDSTSFASACHGDSGGPLQCHEYGRWRLYGVVSWGSPLCNGLDRFTVFTRVSLYKNWIAMQN